MRYRINSAINHMATGTIKSEKAFITTIRGTQQSGTINAGGTAWATIPYTRPDGYKPIGIQQVYIQATNVYAYQWSFSGSADTISVAMRNFGSAATNYTVDAGIVCIKTS